MAQTRIQFILIQLSRKLWVRAAAYAVLGAAIVPLARLIGPFIPADLVGLTGAGSVGSILNILASSMLAVTTFSLSIMVSAYGSAAQAVTPRAVTLLLQDKTSQTVLSTFIGAFLFGLVGIIAIEAQAIGEGGLLVLFLTTIVVICLVVVALIRWISHLTTFGRLSDASARVEEATAQALRMRARQPSLGGLPAPRADPPPGFRPVFAARTGYLLHIDMPMLSACAAKGNALGDDAVVQVASLPGAFVHPSKPLMWIAPSLGKEVETDLCDAFSIGDDRSFDQDPRFGLCVLTEIAERALSPAVNDPGTAIDILGRAVRILTLWLERDPVAVEFPAVSVPPLLVSDLFEDVFPAIARDGAGVYSVQMRLQKALLALAEISPSDFGAQAVAQSARALAEARAKIAHQEDIARLEAVADQVAKAASEVTRGARTL